VALSTNGDVCATGSFDGLVRLWDARTGRLLWTLEGHTGVIWSVALSSDTSLLASGGFDGTLRLWDPRTGAALGTLRPDRPRLS
jgi:WD40 repeat protein